MTFDELVEEVYLLTNRPDLVNETKSAVRAATLKAHGSDFYSRDIFETGVDLECTKFIHSLDLYALLCNFRALKYFRRVKDEKDINGTFLEVITPVEILDSYGQGRTDIAYVAGRVLEIRSPVEFRFALMGAYVFPIVTETGYNSWVALQFPYAIIYEAARVVFKAIGYDEQSAQFNALVAEEYALLKLTALTDVGY